MVHVSNVHIINTMKCITNSQIIDNINTICKRSLKYRFAALPRSRPFVDHVLNVYNCDQFGVVSSLMGHNKPNKNFALTFNFTEYILVVI